MRIGTSITLALTIVGASCGGGDNGSPQRNPTSTRSNGPSNVVMRVNRVDIVADRPGALRTDSNLVNAWGLAFNPMGPAWIAATGTGVSTVYDANGASVIPPVVIPPCRSTTSSPTGVAFNDVENAFMGDTFLFVTEEGTVAGWQPAAADRAVLRVPGGGCEPTDQSTSNYKGATIAKDASGAPRLYAANFGAGTVDVFDAAYAPMPMQGRFVDPELPGGFAPFNVQEVDGRIVVAYAKQDMRREDDEEGLGNGFVSLFDVDGNFIARMISGGELNSPWGIVRTPNTFGPASNRLLIGNFGDGLIHVYTLDPQMGIARVTHEGVLGEADGEPLDIDGLWALRFGVDAGGFRSDVLYFTAGPDDEIHGVFGRLEPVMQ